MSPVGRRLVAARHALFLVGLVAVALALPLARRMQTDQSVQSLFAPDDPRLAVYNRTAEEFGSEATLLAAYSDPEVLTPAGMARLRDFRAAIVDIPGVRSALSLADLPHPRDPSLWRDLGKTVLAGAEAALSDGLAALLEDLREWRPRPLATWMAEASPAEQTALRADILACDLYRDVFINRAGDAVAVVVQIDRSDMATGAVGATLEELRRIAAAHSPEPAKLAGAPAMISDVYGYLENDTKRLQWASTLIMVAVIWALFRNLRWVLLPLLVVWSATVFTGALRALAGIKLSIIGSMTDSLIAVIGIAAVVHVAVLFAEESHGDDKAALERTFDRIFRAFVWTCGITAVGFASLLFSEVRPVREYAVAMAGASIFIGLAAACFIPAGALALPRLSAPAPRRAAREELESGLVWIVRFVGKHSGTTAFAALAVLAVAGWGYRNLELETDFTKNFREDAPVLEAYRFVEERLGGVGVLEIVFDAPAADRALLAKLRECSRELRALPSVTKVSSLADAVEYAETLLGSQRLRRSPVTTAAVAATPEENGKDSTWASRFSKAAVEPGILAAIERLPPGQAKSLAGNFWNPAIKRMRIVMRVRERESVYGKSALVRQVEEITARHLGPSAQPTGLFLMLVFLVDTLVRDQWTAVGVAGACVVVAAAIAFRSLRLGIVAFIPKLALVLAVIGFMGWAGLKVNVATAMIGSVSMGLVVAFSVPYLMRFQQERAAGMPFYAALARTHGSAGAAMVFANLALMFGFLVLSASRFIPTVHFGLLVAVAILGGVAGNLILLPVFLRYAYWVGPPTPAELGESS
ncbi:MAG TPA: MMPL family transporter [Planctomycetia bacterium]|nr:MMPL family transporter [Planctomycetia bacterium]